MANAYENTGASAFYENPRILMQKPYVFIGGFSQKRQRGACHSPTNFAGPRLASDGSNRAASQLRNRATREFAIARVRNHAPLAIAQLRAVAEIARLRNRAAAQLRAVAISQLRNLAAHL